MKSIRLIALFIGMAFFVILIFRIGSEQILEHIRFVKWKILWIPLPYIPIFFFDTLGWRFSFKGSPPRLKALLIAGLAGDALNNLLPVGRMGGEPLKVLALKKYRVPVQEIVASLVVAKSSLLIVNFAFISLGILVASQRLLLFKQASGYAILLMPIGLGAIWFFVLLQRRGLFTSIFNLTVRAGLMSSWLKRQEGRINQLDHALSTYYREKKTALAACLVFYGLGWILGIAEVYVILAILGIRADIASCFLIESLIQAIHLLVFFIPTGIGAREGGSVLLFGALNLTAPLALAFSIMRRLRELVYIGVGLAVLGRIRL